MAEKPNAARRTKAYEEGDPFAFVSIQLDVEEGRDHLREMALVFIEEYRRMGWDDERILALFRNSFFRGPYTVLASRGEAYVKGLLRGD